MADYICYHKNDFNENPPQVGHEFCGGCGGHMVLIQRKPMNYSRYCDRTGAPTVRVGAICNKLARNPLLRFLNEFSGKHESIYGTEVHISDAAEVTIRKATA